MKYYLWFALLLAFSSLSAESWTVLVYMAADNNLAQQGRLDLNSMESVAQPAGLNLIVQADFPEGAYRYRITQDNSTAITSPVLSNLGTIDSGNPYTLNNFLRWGYESFPSDRTMLIIWSHGDSWYKNKGKWICPDDSAENLISISEGDLAKAFISIPKLDVLLFDACSMQGIEVLGEVHSYASYLIGSADLVPVNGFPYETIIPLFEGTLDSILQQIPLLYVESYYPGGEINWGNEYWVTTCSTLKTADYPQFFALFRSFATQHRDLATEMFKIRQQCFSMNTGYADVDLREFLGKMVDSDVPELSNSVTELAALWDEMVISNAHTSPEMIPNIGTAALWFPDSRFNFTNGWQRYSKLSFAKSRWLSVINHALGEDTFAPESPVLLAQNVLYSSLLLSLSPAADPDSIYYELVTDDDSGAQSRFFYPNQDLSIFSITVHIASPGTYALYAIDQSNNRSAALIGSYSFSQPQSSMAVYPNPIRNKQLAMISWWAEAQEQGELILEIYNLKGQKVLSKHLGEVTEGEGGFLLSTEDSFLRLASGVYIVKLHIGKRIFLQKLSILY